MPGLFVGCLLLIFKSRSLGPIDVIFGSLATLIAAVITRQLALRLNLAFPISVKMQDGCCLAMVVSNGLIVGGYLLFLLPDTPVTIGAVLLNMLSIAICEAVVVYAIGIPILFLLKKSPSILRLSGWSNA